MDPEMELEMDLETDIDPERTEVLELLARFGETADHETIDNETVDHDTTDPETMDHDTTDPQTMDHDTADPYLNSGMVRILSTNSKSIDPESYLTTDQTMEMLDRIEREQPPPLGIRMTWVPPGPNIINLLATLLSEVRGLANPLGLANLLGSAIMRIGYDDEFEMQDVENRKAEDKEIEKAAKWLENAPSFVPFHIIVWLRRRLTTLYPSRIKSWTICAPGMKKRRDYRRQDYTPHRKALVIAFFEALKQAGVGDGQAHRITRETCAALLGLGWGVVDEESHEARLAKAENIKRTINTWRKEEKEKGELRSHFSDIFEKLQRAIAEWGKDASIK